jgi:hypothetical protein
MNEERKARPGIGGWTSRAQTFVPRALAGFFIVSAGIVTLVGVTLLFPGTALDRMWLLKPAAHAQLLAYRLWSGPAFLLLAPLFAVAAYGCLSRRRWGWRLAIAIFAIHGVGDLANGLAGDLVSGAVGVLAASAIIYGLTRRGVAAQFN